MAFALDSVAASLTFAGGFRQLLTSYTGALIVVDGPADIGTVVANHPGELDRPTIDSIAANPMDCFKLYNQADPGTDLTMSAGRLKTSGFPIQLGEHVAAWQMVCNDAKPFSDFTTATDGTLLWAGAVSSVSTDSFPTVYSNNMMFGNGGGWAGLYVRQGGENAFSMEYTAGAFIYGTTQNFVEGTFVRYSPLQLQMKWTGGTLYFRINDGAWQSVATESIGNLTQGVCFYANGGTSHHGEGIISDVALSDAVIEAWQAESASYWGAGTAGGGGGGGSPGRVISGAGMVYMD
jgi:hypothetical protein